MWQFDDDVEGTGMGEGEGKKDVTDQIEDEEQLLGLKGDEPDKDQAEEAKELGEDEQDKGMEMENDFEGEMFDVPKGDDKDQDAKVRSLPLQFMPAVGRVPVAAAPRKIYMKYEVARMAPSRDPGVSGRCLVLPLYSSERNVTLCGCCGSSQSCG